MTGTKVLRKEIYAILCFISVDFNSLSQGKQCEIYRMGPLELTLQPNVPLIS